MKDTKIRWAGSTWNPFSGCTEISPGCDHCYAKAIAERFRGGPAYPNGFAPMIRETAFNEPHSWRKTPRRVFVNSTSDTHHEAFSEADIDRVYDVMLGEPEHDYLVLTKRPQRMAAYLLGAQEAKIAHDTRNLGPVSGFLARRGLTSVPPNIWLGTTIESDNYTFRADWLRTIPVPVRFLSCEPLLGPLGSLNLDGIGWVIVGGESGNGSRNFRPMDHDWARTLRDRTHEAGAAFYFKQSSAMHSEVGIELDGVRWEEYPLPAPDTPAAADRERLGERVGVWRDAEDGTGARN